MRVSLAPVACLEVTNSSGLTSQQIAWKARSYKLHNAGLERSDWFENFEQPIRALKSRIA